MSFNFENIVKLSQESELYLEITRNCTLPEVAEILRRFANRTVFKAKGEIDLVRVEKYVPLIDGVLMAQLYGWGQRIIVTGSRNRFAASTFITKDCEEMTIEPEKCTFHGKTDQPLTCTSGIVGGPTPGAVLAIVSATTVKAVGGTPDQQKLHNYHPGNLLRPKVEYDQAITATVREAPTTIEKINTAANNLDLAPLEVCDGVVSLLNNIVPRCPDQNKVFKPIFVVGKYPRIKTPDGDRVRVLQNKEGKVIRNMTSKFNYTSNVFVPTAMKAEAPTYADNMNMFLHGSTNFAMKMMQKNAWSATPTHDMKIEHVQALHDAGIPIGSRILVSSGDTQMISLLRANFGKSVWGIGNGDGMVPSNRLLHYEFDYVYYPKPLTLSYTGVLESNLKRYFESLSAQLVQAVGQIIMHIPPIVYYTSNFCEWVGQEYGKHKVITGRQYGPVERDDLANSYWKPMHYEPIARDKLQSVHLTPRLPGYEGKKYLGQYYDQYIQAILNGTVDEPEDDEEFKGYIKAVKSADSRSVFEMSKLDRDGLVTKNLRTEVTGLLKYDQIMKLRSECCVTNTATKGYALFVEDRDAWELPALLGTVYGATRYVFRDVWACKPINMSSYRIRRITKSTMLDSCEFDDSYSPMITYELSAELRETFEEGLAINIGRHENNPAQREEEDGDDDQGVGAVLYDDDPNNDFI